MLTILRKVTLVADCQDTEEMPAVFIASAYNPEAWNHHTDDCSCYKCRTEPRPLEVQFASHIAELKQQFDDHLDHLCDVCGIDTDGMRFDWMQEVSCHAHYLNCPECRHILDILYTESIAC